VPTSIGVIDGISEVSMTSSVSPLLPPSVTNTRSWPAAGAARRAAVATSTRVETAQARDLEA
jgi:hypothetical protein